MKLRSLVALALAANAATARLAVRSIAELKRLSASTPEGEAAAASAANVDPTTLYPAYNLSVPVDHFHNDSKYEPHSDGMFPLRYWFDASNYKPGGPVIILAGGETSGVGRLVFLQKGILGQLAKATNGIGVVLEHRYYGKSFPTPDLSTANLRFLTTDQALADTAYFVKNVEFKGVGKLNAPETPYIIYGGSYAGAFAAFLRVQYPDLFWGAISSSGVPEAIYDYWAYYQVTIRKHGPKDCIRTTQKLTNIVDKILLSKNSGNISKVKNLFGLGNLTYNDDFANIISYGIGGWQGRNWDPEVNDPSFSEYCGNITSTKVIYPGTAKLKAAAKDIIDKSGYDSDNEKLVSRMLNYIGYVNVTQVKNCKGSQDKCFSNHDSAFYKQDDISQTWRAWPYQYCTEWGYLQTGSGVPKDQLPLISRLIDLPYSTIICREAFNITREPNVQAINKYGGINIEYSRLAFIDGEADPWREASPHAERARPRPNTIDKPFILIKDAVHHWDENGRFPNETTPELPPTPVADAQRAQRVFVQAWLEEFKQKKGNGKPFRVLEA